MPRPRFPRPFTHLTAIALFSLAACWISALIFAFVPDYNPPVTSNVPLPTPPSSPPGTPVRLVYLGLAFFGIAMTLALIYTAAAGWFYFAPRRQYITRHRDPRLFWKILAFLATLTLALTAFAIYKLIL